MLEYRIKNTKTGKYYLGGRGIEWVGKEKAETYRDIACAENDLKHLKLNFKCKITTKIKNGLSK